MPSVTPGPRHFHVREHSGDYYDVTRALTKDPVCDKNFAALRVLYRSFHFRLTYEGWVEPKPLTADNYHPGMPNPTGAGSVASKVILRATQQCGALTGIPETDN